MRIKKSGLVFPLEGTGSEELLREVSKRRDQDFNWRKGKMFGYVYYPGDEIMETVESVYKLFMHDSTLNPTAFGSLRRMENELAAMVGSLFHGDKNVTGSVTSGGTESILMAMKVARNWKRGMMPEVKPEVIVPVSAHPAFDKAAHYLDIKLIHVPLRGDFRADVDKMASAVNEHTAMLVGSAPCFPYGVVDPVEEIAELAVKNRLLCHVDACLGGFMLPFVEKTDYKVPPFDFRVKGVTSISADVHKYGYSVKGASLILYRDPELRKLQFFVTTEWQGGIFVSNALLGSKSGGPVAAAWATVKLMGVKGYMAVASEVMDTTRKMQEGIKATDGLEIVGDPEMSVFAVRSGKYDIYSIGDELEKKGWLTDRLQNPACIHITVGRLQAGKEKEFLNDLREVIALTGQKKREKISDRLVTSAVSALSGILPEKMFKNVMDFASRFIGNNSSKESGSAALYGISAKLKNRNNMKEMIVSIYDKMYRLE